MRNIFKFILLLATALPILAAAPFEFAPVYTNLATISTVGTANRVTALVGGSTVTNLYTIGSGFGGFFLWDPIGSIANWDGTNILDKRIPSPVNAAFTAGAGTLASATYYYRVSAINTLGETVPSTETSFALTGPAGVNVNWSGVPGATGYKIYGRSTGAELFIAQVGYVHTYLDGGSITPSGAMPATNSTMGVQGTWNRLFERIYGPAGPEGGDLTNNFPNPVLVPIIAAAGPIGNATTVPVITFDAKGRLTAVTTAAISGVPPSGAAGGDLGGTYPNPTVVKATALTSGRVTMTIGGIFADDADLTFATDTLTATKLVAPTSVSSPSHISTAAITSTPAAGSGFFINMSGAGDFAVNTDQLYVDTSTGGIGGGTSSPRTKFDILTGGTPNTGGSLAPSLALFTGPSLVPIADGSRAGAMVNIESNTDKGAGVGASLMFGGRYATGSTASTGFGALYGAKENGNDGTIEGYLALSVNNGTGTLAEGARISSVGNFMIGTTTGLAKLSVNGGLAVGEDADPGDNNARITGQTRTGTLIVDTSHTASYATINTVAVFNGSFQLVSSGVTTTTLNYLDATSSVQTQLNARVREPKYDTGDPNTLGTVGDDDGQMFVNTSTGERWWYYAAGPYWLP